MVYLIIDKMSNTIVQTAVCDKMEWELFKKNIDSLKTYSIEFLGEPPVLQDFIEYKYIDGKIVSNAKDRPCNFVKNLNISTIVVTVETGKTFDGDEKSQDRMLRAISIASITGQTETEWKLADNTIVTVSLDELKEALALAGQEMSRIWL